MTSKTTNKFSPEVRDRAVRMVLDHVGEHPSRWAAVTSISAKIGCTPQTLHDWVKKAEIDSGQRTSVPTEMAEKLKALEWLDWFNNRRLLEPIGNIPPAEAEQRYYAMLEQPAMAA